MTISFRNVKTCPFCHTINDVRDDLSYPQHCIGCDSSIPEFEFEDTTCAVVHRAEQDILLSTQEMKEVSNYVVLKELQNDISRHLYKNPEFKDIAGKPEVIKVIAEQYTKSPDKEEAHRNLIHNIAKRYIRHNSTSYFKSQPTNLLSLYDFLYSKGTSYDVYDRTYDTCVTIDLPDSDEKDRDYYDKFCIELAKKVTFFTEVSECTALADWYSLIFYNYDLFRQFSKKHWGNQYEDVEEFIYQWITELHAYVSGYVSESLYKELYELICKAKTPWQDCKSVFVFCKHCSLKFNLTKQLYITSTSWFHAECPGCTNTYHLKNFLRDNEKMADFRELTRSQFLHAYSYISGEEYDITELLDKRSPKED